MRRLVVAVAVALPLITGACGGGRPDSVPVRSSCDHGHDTPSSIATNEAPVCDPSMTAPPVRPTPEGWAPPESWNLPPITRP